MLRRPRSRQTRNGRYGNAAVNEIRGAIAPDFHPNQKSQIGPRTQKVAYRIPRPWGSHSHTFQQSHTPVRAVTKL